MNLNIPIAHHKIKYEKMTGLFVGSQFFFVAYTSRGTLKERKSLFVNAKYTDEWLLFNI